MLEADPVQIWGFAIEGLAGLLVLSFIRLLSERGIPRGADLMNNIRKMINKARSRRISGRNAMTTTRKGTVEEARKCWQYMLETVWAGGAGVIAARLFP